jgi:hypothetical protein
MASIDGLGPNPTKAELEDELVFTRILFESLDQDAFDYNDLMERHTAKIGWIESLLANMEESETRSGTQSHTASQESSTSLHTPPEFFVGGDWEDMLSPVAGFNAMNEDDEDDEEGATGEFDFQSSKSMTPHITVGRKA